MIQSHQLTKVYRHQKVLDALDFQVNNGEICAVIGKNGAGKSTLFKLIANEIFPSSGELMIYGEKHSNTLAKRRFGFLIEKTPFFEDLSALKNLTYIAKLRGVTDKKRIDQVLHTVGLSNAKHKKVKTFSVGMHQRLGIAQALLHNPDCLILDEPINGLDAQGIADIRYLLKSLNKEYGMTILISSHILSELKLIADRFIFLKNGRILEALTSEALEAKSTKYIILKSEELSKAVRLLESHFKDIQYSVLHDQSIKIDSDIERINEINKLLVNNNITIKELKLAQRNIEDYFFELEGEQDNV